MVTSLPWINQGRSGHLPCKIAVLGKTGSVFYDTAKRCLKKSCFTGTPSAEDVHREEVSWVRNYEAMYILKPGMEEEAINTAVARFEDVVKNGGGEITKTDHWGKRRLAYEVNDITEGYYVLMTFTSPTGAAQELERILKIQDDIVRHLVIKKED